MKQRALGDARSISLAIENYKRDHGHYPAIAGDPAADLARAITPAYLKTMPTSSFGNCYAFLSDGGTPVVVELGRNGFVMKRGEVAACHDGVWEQER